LSDHKSKVEMKPLHPNLLGHACKIWMHEAKRRGLSEDNLASRILQAVATDNLFKAVLDE